MSFLGRLFGKKAADRSGISNAVYDPAKDPDMICIEDNPGGPVYVRRQDWRDQVLLPNLHKVWDDPDLLRGTILQSLPRGLGADMVGPAERLLEIDPNIEGATTLLAVVYRKQKRLDDAERILRNFIQQRGETGVVLINVARVQFDRGQRDASFQTLWRALELDPNLENGLAWYMEMVGRREGEAAIPAAVHRVAALPGSWRARIWLAADALKQAQLNRALVLYEEALSLAPRPIPVDLLVELTSELGPRGHLIELLRLAEPHFEVERHGVDTGSNLIRANFELGRLDAARALLARHYAQQRSDWKELLDQWSAIMAKAQSAPPR